MLFNPFTAPASKTSGLNDRCTDAPVNSIFSGPLAHQCCALKKQKNFHMQVRKRKHKGLRVSGFALLVVVFKWHHGSEGVKPTAIASDPRLWARRCLELYKDLLRSYNNCNCLPVLAVRVGVTVVVSMHAFRLLWNCPEDCVACVISAQFNSALCSLSKGISVLLGTFGHVSRPPNNGNMRHIALFFLSFATLNIFFLSFFLSSSFDFFYWFFLYLFSFYFFFLFF